MTKYFKRYATLLALLMLAMAGTLFAREAEHDRLLPQLTSEAFDVQNIYFGAEGRFCLPIGFTGEQKLTGFGFGGSAEAGYDWDGWLGAVRIGYAYYLKGFNESYLMNVFQHVPLTAEISKIFTKKHIFFLPPWLDVRATAGVGVDFFYVDYYKSLSAKSLGVNKTNMGSLLFYKLGVAAEYNRLPNHWTPYAAFNLDMEDDRSGFLFMPSFALGVRKPLGVLAKRQKTTEPAPAEETTPAAAETTTPTEPAAPAEETAPAATEATSPAESAAPTEETTPAAAETTTPAEPAAPAEETVPAATEATSPAEPAAPAEATTPAEPVAPAEDSPVPAETTTPVETTASAEQTASDFTPDGDGENDTLTLNVKPVYGSLYTKPSSWKLDIYSPSGTVFKTISGTGAVPQTITWDGQGDNGETVQSATDYTAKPTVTAIADKDSADGSVKAGDEKSTVSETKIPVGVLVQKSDDGALKILVPSISFDANAATFEKIGAEAIAKNNAILDQIAAILNKYDTYKVSVEGHANNTSGTEKEEVNELIPLSQARADSIKAELVKRGISEERIIAVGKGGRYPVTKDKAEAWKNRRVEFILNK